MDKAYNGLVANMDQQMAALKKKVEQQKIKEEQERLRKIQVLKI